MLDIFTFVGVFYTNVWLSFLDTPLLFSEIQLPLLMLSSCCSSTCGRLFLSSPVDSLCWGVQHGPQRHTDFKVKLFQKWFLMFDFWANYCITLAKWTSFLILPLILLDFNILHTRFHKWFLISELITDCNTRYWCIIDLKSLLQVVLHWLRPAGWYSTMHV